jgi:hypothetical protein
MPQRSNPLSPPSASARVGIQVDHNDHLLVELWCSDQMLQRRNQWGSSAGSGFVQEVAAGEACDVRLRQTKADPSTRHRVSIKYPH